MGIVLSEVTEENVDQLYSFYLNDFVRYVHKTNHKNKLQEMEYKVHIPAVITIIYMYLFDTCIHAVDYGCTRCSDSRLCEWAHVTFS